MENLIVYPENLKQLQILKSLLEEMKIKFKSEEQVEELLDWQKKLIDEGLKDVEEGKLLSREEVNKRIEECFK